MATLVLQTAGAAIGGMFGPVGAVVGRALGGLAGAAIDNAFLGAGSSGRGARLKNIDVTGSTEGTPMPRAFGRVRVSGQIIWTTHVEAVRVRERSGGGKGGSGTPASESVSYFANVALGLCEGPIARIGRVWADGKPLDAGAFNMRVHRGGEDQEPDPLIVAKEGAENAPAYRGLAYVVFERMPLEKFGNRVPQLAFEVIRPVGAFEQSIRAVTLIPGATEFGYDTERVQRVLGIGESVPENQHTASGEADIVASLDELQAVCPNIENISLVVSWFGDDLRCGHCTVKPRVDSAIKKTSGGTWSVAGRTRATAQLVSMHDGRPAYGGTPSDSSVIRAIQEIKARGLKVTLYPFLMMDIPADNELPHPASGLAPQPAYPWRGEIRAAGNGTASAASEIAQFFGTAEADDYSVSGGAVQYSGPSEWGWRRFVLHMAHLGKAAGGVDAILIGSEFRDLTRSRDEAGSYPATDELIALAGEVRSALPAAKITYAADWTEYGAHVTEGGGEVRFPLDPLWADANVDAVGIDFYPPFADWRDGAEHLDRAAANSIYDIEYLKSNVTGGEFHDWYYLDDEDRAAQERMPITDGLGKPWVFRAKDIRSWWDNAHYERAGGAELPAPTSWVPQSKPIWLTEIGCPAVDKGSNAPNVFPDPKSSTAVLPPFSSGDRDDLIQRRTLQAVMDVYGSEAATNPASSIYDAPMVDPERTALWTWDARPYPAFPLAETVWADGPAHETGHWLTGRLGQTTIAELAAAILAEGEAAEFETYRLEGVIDGYAIDRPASVREALEPLAELFAFGACERAGKIILVPRGQGEVRTFTTDELAASGESAEPQFVRQQESELPQEISVGFADPSFDFQPRVAGARRRGAEARGIVTMDTAVTAPPSEMQRRAEIRLQDMWVGRDAAGFALPPSDIALEPGDAVALDTGGEFRLFEITEIADGPVRQVSARAIAPDMLRAPRALPSAPSNPVPQIAGPPEIVVLDLPSPDGDPPVLTRVAAAAKPWPGGIVFWREAGGTFEPAVRANAPAVIGETLDALAPGPAWRFDRASTVTVRISDGVLSSASDERLFAGANLCAIRNPDGAWEVLQFGNAELVAPATYRLSRFLRGQSGTEAEASVEKPAGSTWVLLDTAVIPLVRGLEALGRPVAWRAAAAGRDHADPFAVAFTSEPGATALRPLSPVHVRARRDEDGIGIDWTRRTRMNGDVWEISEVPLGETDERYRVDILDGGEVLRTAETDLPHFLYAANLELADFGAPQSILSIRIAQISSVTGPGRATEVMLNV